MKPWVVTLGAVLAALNVLFLIFWLGLTTVKASNPPAGVSTYDAISLQITILSITVGAVTIGLAVAGVFGYQALQTLVLDRSERLVNEHLAKLQPKPGMRQTEPSSTATPGEAEGGEPEEEGL